VSRDDPFAGGVAPRLRRLDRELAAATTDAQCRDWAADRPDRVGFARLGQVRRELGNATARYRAGTTGADRTMISAVLLAVLLVGVPLLLLVPGPAQPARLTAIAVAGVWAAYLFRAVLRRLRIRWARKAPDRPAPIDDPFLYARARRTIESCAASARADRSYRRRGAAADLEYALDWLAAAQEELPRAR
jgi:hypothetical protein